MSIPNTNTGSLTKSSKNSKSDVALASEFMEVGAVLKYNDGWLLPAVPLMVA